ncbi:NinB protein [Agaricicola taiwanensis]|uniref:NinB protein n=1 Tax=Agaricicola taiwanensis TaxID=591372 RepID=A0A8J2YE90_9RHOB|nr:recombination protein NinB [Agaricicola taiwanensis]GGE36120.1 NinB protein [Agaricicola taiwanensis]
MGRATVVLTSQADKQKAAQWVMKAPWNTRVTFAASKRSLPQNDRMWAMLTDIASQMTYHGIKLAPDDWKLLFLDALKREVRMVPNLEGNGFVSLGRSSSDLSKQEMSDLIEVIFAWGANNGVVFHDDQARAA